MSEKMWGAEPFWGLGYDWDPDWVLTERQKELRSTLIELCEQEMRANAKRSDDELLYPRRNLELLGEHGFLALTVPEEYGGLGENHVAFSMTCETIARYGCASTAMCYVMHMGAVQAIMLRPTPELIDKYIRPLNTGLIGTLSYSDPETGSHFWYPIASGARAVDGGYEVLKKASWTTSAGFADFYVLQTTSPDYNGDYSNLSVFVVDKSEIEAKLYESDPGLARDIADTTIYTHAYRNLKWGLLGFFLGLVMLVLTLSVNFYLSFGGFLIMLVSALTVERNLIEGNFAGDDGGAMFIQQALTAQLEELTRERGDVEQAIPCAPSLLRGRQLRDRAEGCGKRC